MGAEKTVCQASKLEHMFGSMCSISPFMVESDPVTSLNEAPAQGPVEVLTSLARGFDRITARPVLILPPVLLDLFLWLGPRMGVAPFIRSTAQSLTPPAGADALLQQQAASIQTVMAELAGRLNLLRSLSSLPAGIPSLMSGLMPSSAPLQIGPQIELSNPTLILACWVGLTIAGLGLGTWYHRSIAASVAPGSPLTGLLPGWMRMILGAILGYVGLALGTLGILLVGWAASWILPLLGVGLSFIAFSLFFWLVVYLAFTPHGIVRYGMGLFQAMAESMLLVRWNFLPTVGFLTLAVLISWLTGIAWGLPQSTSWLTGLGVLGHTFISAMLLASSYVFYQSRREWLLRTRKTLEVQLQRLQQSANLEPGSDVGPIQGDH